MTRALKTPPRKREPAIPIGVSKTRRSSELKTTEKGKGNRTSSRSIRHTTTKNRRSMVKRGPKASAVPKRAKRQSTTHGRSTHGSG